VPHSGKKKKKGKRKKTRRKNHRDAQVEIGFHRHSRLLAFVTHAVAEKKKKVKEVNLQ